MNKQNVIDFFDKAAAGWDRVNGQNRQAVAFILDHAGLFPGARVLDVACGTGVLFSEYRARAVGQLTGVDISREMIRTAQAKFPEARLLCADAETEPLGEFDCIVVYNAFPHFAEPERLIRKLASELAPGGTLTVAHGMSREQINAVHSGKASDVSAPLLPVEELEALMGRYLQVRVAVSDDSMYQVSGVKADAPRDGEAPAPAPEVLRESGLVRGSAEEQAALLAYLLRHNGQHAEEFLRIRGELAALGRTAAAAKLDECLALLREADAKLAEAEELLKGEL